MHESRRWRSLCSYVVIWMLLSTDRDTEIRVHETFITEDHVCFCWLVLLLETLPTKPSHPPVLTSFHMFAAPSLAFDLQLQSICCGQSSWSAFHAFTNSHTTDNVGFRLSRHRSL